MSRRKHSAAQQFAAPFDNCSDQTSSPDSESDIGIIVRKSTGRFGVQLGQDQVPCTLLGRLRHQLWERSQGQSKDDPLAVGDRVRVRRSLGGEGAIVERLPRRNQLARRAAGRKAREQVIAANVDRVVCAVAVESPIMRLNLLDRFLVEAESAGIEPLIVLTKVDLDEEGCHRRALDPYRALGYAVLCTSSRTGEGMDELRREQAGRTSVLLGASGVGKSSLLNALEPRLGLRVKELSRATGKGRHTTTTQEMFPLDAEMALIALAVRPLSKLPFPIEPLPCVGALRPAGGVAE